MVVNLQQDVSRLIEVNSKLSTTVDDLTAKNSNLASQMESLTLTLTLKPVSPAQTKLNTPNPLIGDSTIRDVACTDPSALHIVSRAGGAKTGDILQSLRKMKTDTFGDVMIHVGTNDCCTKFPTQKIGNNICDIVSQAKRVSTTGHVTLSSITPRSDNKNAADKGDTVNTVMESIAGESGCLFVNHHDNFLCRNGDIIDEMLTIDGLHLSKKGTIRLIENLKLQSAACCRIGMSARPGGETQLATPAAKPTWPGNTQAPWEARRQLVRHPPQRTQSSTPGGDPRVRSFPGGDRRPARRDDGRRAGQAGRNHNPFDRKATAYNDSMNTRYCNFCGEENHRDGVCRFGMPVKCFLCHHEGHKQKFCNLYNFR